VLLGTQVSQVEGHSGKEVRVHAKDGTGERIVEGTDLLVSVARTPNTTGVGLEQAGVELDARAAISRSTTASRRRHPTCGRWATVREVRNSLTSRTTTSASCVTT
jgi:pyruvate/2-oxoglutarate dehydrogenase complex dihydrolipoamide dehydrogenase (E3) component